MTHKNGHNLDFAAAGRVLENEIIPRLASNVRAFAKYKGVSDSSLLQIIAGKYNKDVGASPTLLFRNALEIENGNVEAAQFLVAQYMIALGVIPEDHDVPILKRLSHVEDELREIKRVLLKKAKKPAQPSA